MFSELITLVEPSKGIGASEQLRAMLPYDLSRELTGIFRLIYSTTWRAK